MVRMTRLILIIEAARAQGLCSRKFGPGTPAPGSRPGNAFRFWCFLSWPAYTVSELATEPSFPRITATIVPRFDYREADGGRSCGICSGRPGNRQFFTSER